MRKHKTRPPKDASFKVLFYRGVLSKENFFLKSETRIALEDMYVERNSIKDLPLMQLVMLFMIGSIWPKTFLI